MADISEAMVEVAQEAALREGAFLGEDMVRYMLDAALSAAPASAQMDELSRLREANRKLHRRVQIAEAFQQSMVDMAESWGGPDQIGYIAGDTRKEFDHGWRAACRSLSHKVKTRLQAIATRLRESLPTAEGETNG